MKLFHAVILPLLWILLPIELPAASKVLPLTIGRSVATLSGPWKFHTGDNPEWAGVDFDDSDWEDVDLTPASTGAHDDDVGLTGYVPGWTARGHSGYSGFAWYRMRISVSAPPGVTLALSGPPLVDDAYQLFLNGTLMGGCGDFSKSNPIVYSIQPRIYPFPRLATLADAPTVLSFRVWMGPAETADAGGIHIAPALGEANSIDARYQLQWLETFRGYVVDVAEPAVFILLAVMALVLSRFARDEPAYRRLSLALLLLSIVRVNQAVYFWMQWESIGVFDLTRNVLLLPLGLGAWTMFWCRWFHVRQPASLPRAVGALTLVYLFSQSMSRSLLSVFVFHQISASIRLTFVLLTIFIAYRAIKQKERDVWLALTGMVLISAGLYALELTTLHVTGIWFPFGTGVSRTQFAYAAFDVVFFALLLRRFVRLAPPWSSPLRRRRLVSTTSPP